MRQSHDDSARALAARLEEFDPIALDGLKDPETQFLMTIKLCAAILSDLRETQYYDTDAFPTYIQHHNGKADRYKLRFRRYLSPGGEAVC